jgi:hypothetical protein
MALPILANKKQSKTDLYTAEVAGTTFQVRFKTNQETIATDEVFME